MTRALIGTLGIIAEGNLKSREEACDEPLHVLPEGEYGC